MAYSAGTAIKDVLTGNVEYASDEQAKARMDICRQCPHMQQVMRVCQSCGCFLPAKVKFAMSSCPKEKW
jgi:hypothetical protein